MTNLIRFAVLFIIFSALLSGSDYAATDTAAVSNAVMDTMEWKSVTGIPDIKVTRKTDALPAAESSGTLIAEASVTLINDGGGVLGGVARTNCYVQVENICMTLLLQQYNDSTGSWNTVTIREYEYSAADYENEFFSSRSVSFEISGLEIDCFYRLTGLHSVTKDGQIQSHTTQTDGLLLSKY